MKKLITLTCILFSCSAFAEYRVYQYYVRAYAPNPDVSEAYLVTSFLNPESYVAYHGGHHSIEVELLRSWVCPGDTSKKKICKAPIETLLEE